MSDAFLLDRQLLLVATGDRAPIEEIYRTLLPLAERYARRRLPAAADVDDVIQRAFIEFFERAHEYRPEHPAAAFFFTLLYYQCRTELTRLRRARGRSARISEPDLQMNPSLSTQPSQLQLEEEELAQVARKLLEDLAPNERALLLPEGQDMQDWEASFQGISAVALRKRKQRILARLRQEFQRAFGLDEEEQR